jgi:secreted PhoX family phosphatase
MRRREFIGLGLGRVAAVSLGSELTGVTFDPSGARMFVASQRAFVESELEAGPGAIYEITGPFRGARA